MQIPPLFAGPPDLRCETGPLWAWYTSPAGAVVQQMEAGVFSKSMAEWIVGPGYEAFSARFRGQEDLRLLLDLRMLTSREPAARKLIMEAGAKYLRTFARVTLLAPLKPPPLYMTTLSGAVALLSAFGPDITIAPDVPSALQRLSIKPR